MHRYQRKDMGNMKKQGNMKPPKEHNNSPETYSNMKNSQNLRRIKIIDIKEVKWDTREIWKTNQKNLLQYE